MAEQEAHLSKETLFSRKPAIHFERASHALSAEEQQLRYDRFLQGDKTAHGWNREVTESMASYQPLFLALDGQEPLFTGSLAQYRPELRQLPLTDVQKQLLWFATPGPPSEINKQGVVSVVAGDVMYNSVFPFLRDVNQLIQDMQTGQAIGNAFETLQLDSSDEYFSNPKINGLAQLLEMSVEDVAIALPIAVGARNIARRAIQYHPTKQTRREFFKRSIPPVVGTLAFLSGWGGLTAERIDMTNGDQIALTPDEQTRVRLQAIAAILRPHLERSIYADGRTALLDAKLRAFMQDKQEAGAIVMGSFHDPDVIHTKQEEDDLIHAYAQDVLATVDELRDALKVKPTDSRERDNALLQYLAKTDVYTVSDPGGPTINPKLSNIVPQYVNYKGTFQCLQIEQAVSGLRK